MKTETLQTVGIVMVLLMQLVIPLLLILWVGLRKSKSKINLIVKLLAAWTYCIYVFYAGQWSFLPYYLRYVFLVLLLLASVRQLIAFNQLPVFERKKIWGWTKFSLQVLFAFFVLMGNIEVIKGLSTSDEGIDIAFPLKEGFVGHGGNSVFLNIHQADTTAQHYALDITKLDGWGLRASGFFPSDLDKYNIYGDTLYSPCNCKVVETKDGLDNLPPGTKDTVNITGNYIILEHQGNLIFFGHLLKNSIAITTGEQLKEGQPMAQIGNSGHTSEPHLHIHAIKGTDPGKILKGQGIPIYFKGKFLSRNDRFKR